MDRSVRSRTSSTSSLRSPLPPATPSHTPNAQFSRLAHASSLSPDQLVAGISRIRAERGGASTASSIPATPAPTPNPLLQVTYHIFPEQLAAGLNNIRVDEGFPDDGASFPATPAPTPFSPSPAQNAAFTPDQVVAGIQRLREEGGGIQGGSGTSTGQPPTPSTTPGPGANFGAAANQPLGIIPEHLAEGIHSLRRCDEGLESGGSNPATPIPTPLSPSPATRNQFLPEQLAAGIHRLQVEEGMSSGGSSGFPSTPAPTPFIPHPGGVRPEELAAGISRLSVIEEAEVSNSSVPPVNVMEANASATSAKASSGAVPDSQPELSSYFGGQSNTETSSVFDQLEDSSVCSQQQQQQQTPVKDSGNNMSSGGNRAEPPPPVCNIFSESKDGADPFNDISSQQQQQQQQPAKAVPSSLELTQSNKTHQGEGVPPLATPTNASAAESLYSTPVAPTPVSEQQQQQQQVLPPPPPMGSFPANMTSTPIPTAAAAAVAQPNNMVLTPGLPPYFNAGQPITSPLPVPSPAQPASVQLVSQLSSSSSALDDTLESATSENDAHAQRRHEAWLPGPATAQILSSAAAAHASGASFYPDRAALTQPVVAAREDLADPVRQLVAHFRGEAEAQKRQVLTADAVTQDQRGLRQLVRAGCYRAAINLTARLLQMYNQGPGQGGGICKHTPSSLQLWLTRIALLLKLRQFSVAEAEAEPFGDLDRPDLYFQFYPDMYPGRRGSMVPFGFRLLVAELPQFLGKQHEAVDRLYALRAKIKKMLSHLSQGKSEDGSTLPAGMSEQERKDAETLWRQRELRVMYAMANCAINQKDFETAVSSLEELMAWESTDKKPKLHSALGRVYLQLGDIDSAQAAFSQAYQLRRQPSSSPAEGGDAASASSAQSVDSLVDVAFLAIANSDYQSALTQLQKAHDLAKSAPPSSSSASSTPMIVNNMAVCLLYLGRLKEGLTFLESVVISGSGSEMSMLQETPILNLCTLYELESSYADQKKRSLLDLVSQYKGDGINAACLKLPM